MTNYLHFLNLMHEFEKNFTRKYHLTPRDLKMLEVVAVCEFVGPKLKITDLLALSKYGSPASIYRALNQLRDMNLVVDTFQANNRRTKYLRVGEAAQDFYTRLGELLIDSLNSK